MECLVTGNNENIANAKNVLKSELISCTGEDEILNFTTKVLPKLCFEKKLIEDHFFLDRSDIEVTDDVVADEIKRYYDEECAERYLKANEWLYKIKCIHQERKKIFTVTNGIYNMIDTFFMNYENESDLSIFKQCIKDFCIKDINKNSISKFKQRIIDYCIEEANKNIKNSKNHAELEIENDEELYKLMQEYLQCKETEFEMDYEEYVEDINPIEEANNYYISCFSVYNGSNSKL